MSIYDFDSCDSVCDPFVEIVECETRVDIFLPGPPGPAGGITPSKRGIVLPGSFSGTPKKNTVVFTSAFTDTNYSICITGGDSRIFTYENKTTSGFIISANSNSALSNEVSWTAIPIGESP